MQAFFFQKFNLKITANQLDFFHFNFKIKNIYKLIELVQLNSAQKNQFNSFRKKKLNNCQCIVS